MSDVANHPLDEVLRDADERIAAGWTVYQKFTCAGCGSRLTIETPNVFHKLGTCDKCDAVTDIVKTGCNFMAVSGSPI